jgi:hypothetical protein
MLPISLRLDQYHCQKGLNVAISWHLDQNHCQKVPNVAEFMAPGSKSLSKSAKCCDFMCLDQIIVKKC